MSKTPDAKLIENEVIFAQRNQAMKQQVSDLFQGVAEGLPLAFYCECSNEDCKERIVLGSDEYDVIHKDPRRFMVIEGHETYVVERLVKVRMDYSLVEKDEVPPTETDGRLNNTDL